MRGLCHHSNDGDFLEGGGESFWNPIAGWFPTGCDAIAGNWPAGYEPLKAVLDNGLSLTSVHHPITESWTYLPGDQGHAIMGHGNPNVNAWGHPFIERRGWDYQYRKYWSHYGSPMSWDDYYNPRSGEPTGCRRIYLLRPYYFTSLCQRQDGPGGPGTEIMCTMPLEIEIRLTALPNYPLGVPLYSSHPGHRHHNCMPARPGHPSTPWSNQWDGVKPYHPAVGIPVPFSFCDEWWPPSWAVGAPMIKGTGGENGVGFITMPKRSDTYGASRSAEGRAVWATFSIQIPDPPCVFVLEFIDRNYRYSPGIENGVPVRGWPEANDAGQTYEEYHAGFIDESGAAVDQTAYTTCYRGAVNIFQRYDVEYGATDADATGQWCAP